MSNRFTSIVGKQQSQGQRLPLRPNNFDLVRLFAALQVVFFHGIENLDIAHQIPDSIRMFFYAFPGVPMFFFISGFLISAALERSNSFSSYAINRFLRIFPGLWVCFVFAAFTVLIFAPSLFAPASFKDLLVWIGAQVSFLQFYNPDFLRPYGVGTLNGSLWTIPVELQFYFALPVVYLLLPSNNRLRRWALLGLIIFFLVVNQIFNLDYFNPHVESTAYKLVGVSMLPYFWLFLVGVLLQQNFHRVRVIFEGKVLWWLCIHGLCVLITMYSGFTYGSNHPFPLTALSLCGLTLSGAYSYTSLSDKLLNRNDISYGVYIYHMIIANVMIHLGMTGQLLYWPLLVLLSVICGYLSWRFVEKPCLSKKRHNQPVLQND